MQIHQLSVDTKKKKKRVGRGGKRGTFSGRGTKGQRSRAGARIRPQERDIVKKIPKLRGYHFRPYRKKPIVVNIAAIEKKFKEGETISPKALLKAGLIAKQGKRVPEVKILGKGDCKKKFIFKDVQMSSSVKLKVAK